MTKERLNINTDRLREEEQFYSSYEWCLNPAQKLRDLFVHLAEELDHSVLVSKEWQREECAINIYLLACAIACTVDDYLVWRPWVLTPVGNALPALRVPVNIVQTLANIPYLIFSWLRRRFVYRWRRDFTAIVDESCRLLLAKRETTPAVIDSLKKDLARLQKASLPEDLLNRRMKINEGYRCQDLTHHDILTLTNRFLESNAGLKAPVVVIGPRTAGAYFAPVVKTYLEQKGFHKVSWMTIRPKLKTARREYHQLRQLMTDNAHFILTDDYSNTGLTFRLLQEELQHHGVEPGRITIFAPLHPTRPDIELALHPETKVLALRQGDLFKEVCLDPRSVEGLLKEYLLGPGDVVLPDDPEITGLNRVMWDHYKDGFQVRLKRVYRVRADRRSGGYAQQKIIGKSVGWGWLGYHAYFAGARLRGFVPDILSLRNGILFMEWVEATGGQRGNSDKKDVPVMAEYVAQRARRLGLPEDPRFRPPDIGWGWLEILSILRRAYGSYPGYAKHRVLLEKLVTHQSPRPTLIDGHMGPGEWVDTDSGPVKIDFEHHNFGAPELDIVDPAYDLAAIIFEYHLSGAEEKSLLDIYREKSGDTTIADRTILYKLLYGHNAKRMALEGFQREHTQISHEDWNQRYQWSWNFLVFTMNRVFSSRLSRSEPVNPEGHLLFLDLDGVLDAEYFGFPHTTPSGIQALDLLSANGCTVVPNTGRSILHVRNYCASYGFTVGIAEYGSVIFDARHEKEIPLISTEAEDELECCREALSKLPDVYVDRGYRYAVRAYRYTTRRTTGLESAESEEILKKHRLTELSIIRRTDDTYFVWRGTGKGNGIKQFRNLFPQYGGPVAAIGDSDEDLSMLEVAEKSFAPSNCSGGVRKLAEKKKCRIIPQPRQRGLLKVAELLVSEGPSRIPSHPTPGDNATISNLLITLAARAEQPRIRKIVSLLHPNSL